MTGRGHLLEKLGMVARMLADREEQTLGAFVRKRLQHRGRVTRPRTVVEGQHDFLVGEKIELLEMLEAEARPAGGVDLDHTADTERVGICASRLGRRRNRLLRNGRGDFDVVVLGGCLRGKPLGLPGADGLGGRHIGVP